MCVCVCVTIYYSMQVEETTTSAEYLLLMQQEQYDFRFNCGCAKPTTAMTFGDKEEFINAVWLHYVFFQPHAELEQLRKGFRETLQVEIIACVHGKCLHSVLAATPAFDPTSKHLLDELAVNYAPERSNMRMQEEAIMLYWSDYICECESQGMYIS